MWVHRGATHVEVRAPAKLNLFFEVLGRRDDGFHEIETLMVPVSLFDSLSFMDVPPRASQPVPITLNCTPSRQRSGEARNCSEKSTGDRPPAGENHGCQEQHPQGHENIVVRAVELLRRRAGTDHGAALRLVKRIPLSAGLGGGSSDAAAALVAANLGWSLGWSRQQLLELAAELGSDVPFFLSAGPAICRGRGERVEPVGGFGDLHAVVVRPPAGLSTAAVYARCEGAPRPRSPQPLCKAIAEGRQGAAGRLICNRLEGAAKSLSPWIGRLEAEFAGLDCLGHQMSGSGSSYFGLCRHARHARCVAGKLAARRIGSVYAVRRAY